MASKISKAKREQIKAKSGGVCWYCGNPLPKKGWHVDHVMPVIRETAEVPRNERKKHEVFEVKKTGKVAFPDRECMDNMVPACASCNLFKSVLSVEEFRYELEKQIERGRKNSVNFRTAERFGLIKIIHKPVVFWFEKNNK